MKLIRPVDMYNEAVPLMNELQRKGYNINTYHSNSEGYGFYVDSLPNNHYIKVSMFSLVNEGEYIVDLRHKEGNCLHDIMNDKEIKTIRHIKETELEKLKDAVYTLITEGEQIEKQYNIIGLTQKELDYLKIKFDDPVINDMLQYKLKEN